LRKRFKKIGIYNLLISFTKHLKKTPMKKALKITGKILYFILALSPIFALGYMLGLKLL